MTQRIRDVLDGAVAGLEPGARDPVAAVVRRGRAARRRSVLAAALVVALLGGGLAAGRQLVTTAREPAPAGPTELGRPPVPRVAGREVVAGAMRLPIPEGWTVVTNDPARPCGDLHKTILLVVTDNRGCQNASVEIYGTEHSYPGGTLVGDDLLDEDRRIVTPPVAMTLRGGEPAWMSESLDAADLAPDRYPDFAFWNVVTLPWSMVMLQLRDDGPAERTILDSIVTTPTEAGVLALPDSATSVSLTTPDAKGRNLPAGAARTKDQATVAAVIALLRAQSDVVDDAAACANGGQPRAAVSLESATPTMVVITLGGGCQEAVSSAGGRVRLNDATLARLKTLLGIGAR